MSNTSRNLGEKRQGVLQGWEELWDLDGVLAK